MSSITYKTILKLISDINLFAEQSDQNIQQLWNQFNNSKLHLESQYNQFMANASGEFESSAAAVKKKAAALKGNADKIFQEVLKLDTILANGDKYYVKTRDKKIEELAQKTKASIIGDVDAFSALEKTKEQYMKIAEKYTREMLPSMIDGISYIFSKQRKQDYEDLIVLKNTLEKLMEEIKKAVLEIVDDSLRTSKGIYEKKTAEIEMKYQAELSSVSARYENSVETLADEICIQLDVILPDSLLYSLKEINARYSNTFSDITPSGKFWDGSIIVGYIDYPLEIYVSSKILFSLIRDKCAAIVVQNKLLRFPLVFSLSNNLNLLIKHIQESDLKNQFISSIMHSFIAFVPVGHLAFTVLDSEHQGKSMDKFAEFYQALPSLFNNRVITSTDSIADALEKYLAYINGASPIEFDIKNTYIKVLIVFDSPEVLGDKNVALINNIIKNGSNHGVYTIICKGSALREQDVSLPYHEKSCVVIQQAMDMFLYYSLRVTCNNLLEGGELSSFINKYLVLCDTLDSNIPLLDSVARELITSETFDSIQASVSSIKNALDGYNRTFGVVPLGNHIFPATISIGSLSYSLGLINDPFVLEQLGDELPNANSDTFKLPAIIDLREKSNLILTYSETNQQLIEKFAHSLMWAFLSSIPISKVNFCIFDAERRGNSITPFLDFRQKLPELFDGHIYTAQDAMMARLQKLNKYIDEFIQEKLGNRFENIIEHNINAPKHAGPITVLLIFDFPRNFDSRSIDLLLNILSNGSKCGIYTIMCYNPNISFSKYENIDEYLASIMKYCSLVDCVDGKYTIQPYGLSISIMPELSKNKISNFVDEYIKINAALKNRGLSFEDVVNKPFFSLSTGKKTIYSCGSC